MNLMPEPEKKYNPKKRYQGKKPYYFKEKKKPPSGKEFGRAGQDILNKYGLSNENPDSLVATKGMEHLDDIERDTHLASSLATRRAKLIGKGWRIVPASDDSADIDRADFIRWTLINMQGAFEKDMEGSLDAIGKGFSITEINTKWMNWNGRQLVGLKNLRYKEPKLFSFKFDKLGYFKLNQIDPDPGGVELPLEKFIHIIMGPNDENPYGRSVDAECAFWVWVKKNVAKFWAIFAEKFGMPLAQVVIPRNIEPGSDEYTKIEEILEGIQEETGIRVPEGFEVKFLEAMRTAEAGYEKFIETCNREISKRVFGATLVAEEGKRGTGSYALGTQHGSIFEEYITFDAAVMEAAYSEQLIKRLIDFNWDVSDYPRFEFIEFSTGIFITFSQSIQNLVNVGLDISKDWVYEKLRIPKPRDGEDVLIPVKQDFQPGFNKPDNKIKMAEEPPPQSPLANGGGFIFEDAFKNIDDLTDRYKALLATEYESAMNKIKKKSLAASGSS